MDTGKREYMNIEQIRYVVAVAERGSINKAARDLYISQPHLSQNIKNVENEMGYQIFDRFSGGIALTPKGRIFLNHCEIILKEYKKAQILSEEKSLRTFHLAAGGLYLFTEAFTRLCEDYEHDQAIDLQLSTKNIDKTVESVYQGACQLGILLLRDDEKDVFEQTAIRKGLVIKKIYHINSVLTVREGHPLLKKDKIDLEGLYEYPFVDYGDRDISTLYSKRAGNLINADKMILIDERETRHRIVSRTDAFAIGCQLVDELLDQYHLVSIPLDIPGFQIAAVYLEHRELTEESQNYLRHLDDVIEEKLR